MRKRALTIVWQFWDVQQIIRRCCHPARVPEVQNGADRSVHGRCWSIKERKGKFLAATWFVRHITPKWTQLWWFYCAACFSTLHIYLCIYWWPEHMCFTQMIQNNNVNRLKNSVVGNWWMRKRSICIAKIRILSKSSEKGMHFQDISGARSVFALQRDVYFMLNLMSIVLRPLKPTELKKAHLWNYWSVWTSTMILIRLQGLRCFYAQK